MALKDIESGSGQPQGGLSPGQMIAAGREAKSINATELAARLRLDTKIVQALERDDFQNLPAPMFVKGYIRSIAKELDIDPVKIVEAYEAHAVVAPPTLADFSSHAPDQVGVNSTGIKAVSYGLVAILTLLIIAWWRSNNEQPTTSVDVANDNSIPQVSADQLPNNFPEIKDDADRWLLELAQTESIAGAIVTEPDLDETVIETDVEAQGQLHISTSSEAWIEIYDGEGARLYYATAKAGDPIEIEGQGYYRLILGNSESITLRHNDEEIDLNRYSSAGVAQLELGIAPDDAQRAP
jgi:cytoskeleton protein RodZ